MQNSRFITLLVVLALCVAGLSTQLSSPQTVNAQTGLLRVAYMPSWAGTVTTYQVCKLTHVTYAFALPNADGTLAALDNTAKLQSLITTAHGCGVKVTLSVGGYNEGVADFKSISANSTYRTNFANNLASLVQTYSLDGVDIDWEYPDASGADSANYTAMLQAIRNKLNTQFGTGTKLLTAAVSAGSYGGAGIASTAFALWDYAMIMAYDGDAGAGHSPYSFAVSALDYWNGRGLAYSKMLLGVPFYARPDWYGYNVLRSGGCSADADTCVYPAGGTTQYYNGRPTLLQKINLVKTRAAKGIMAWDLSQDTQTDSDSLLRYIYCNTGGSCGSVPTNTPAPATATRTNTPAGATSTPTKTPTKTNTPVAGATSTPTKTPTKTNTPGGIAAWAPNVNYAVGAIVSYGGFNWQCLQAHTSQIGWEPPNVPALWKKL
jgi:chitinase